MDVALPRGLTAALLALLAAACSEAAPPRFAQEDCRVLRLTDAQSGAAIIGIEDAARLDDGTLLLSAYDRLAVERALRRGGAAPEGNLYRIGHAALVRGEHALEPLLPEGAAGGEGLRPHGIAAANGQVALINRGVREGMLAPRPLLFAFEDDSLRPVPTAEGRRPLPWCAANDVALTKEGLSVSFDRAGCGGFRPLQTLGVPRGALLFAGAVTPGLSFANGLVPLPQGGMAVAETRGKRVRVIGGPFDGRHYPLPGAPDNLTLSPDGRILAAVQPSLMRFALYRYGITQSAPSALVLLDPATGQTERLYEGSVLPGLTFGILTEEGLIAGSARAAGLLSCRAPS